MVVVVSIALVFLFMISRIVAIPLLTADTVTITVIDKERIQSGEDSRYLVFTESETFKNTDCLVRRKFDSSDLYGRLQVGTTYEAEVYGWRIPFLSAYRNIVRVTTVEE